MTQDRLIALEEKLAYQEHTLQELNSVLIAQQQRIDVLERRCGQLQQRLEGMAERLESDDLGDETPPHY